MATPQLTNLIQYRYATNLLRYASPQLVIKGISLCVGVSCVCEKNAEEEIICTLDAAPFANIYPESVYLFRQKTVINTQQ